MRRYRGYARYPPYSRECEQIRGCHLLLSTSHSHSSRYVDESYWCLTATKIDDGTLTDKAHDLRPYFSHPFDTRPNLFLEANFTGLMSPGQLPNTNSDVISDSMRVYLAMTNDTEDVLLTTRPTYLFPGSNAIGVADLIVRQRLKVRELSTLGLFDVSYFSIQCGPSHEF